MEKDINKLNEDLIKFWDEAIKLPEDYKEQERNREDRDYKEIVPSEKLLHAVSELGKCDHVLDYGCGSGWASIVAIKSGCKDVTAVDIGENIVDAIKFYAEMYDVKEHLNAFSISPDWIKTVPSDSYDGLVCSNVLDVVPLETTKEILKEMHRIVKNDSKIIISLNFYFPPEAAKARGIELIEDKYLIMDGVLRLMSLKDEEWEHLFEPYFKVEKLDYFSWPGEPKESRRLFTLSKK